MYTSPISHYLYIPWVAGLLLTMGMLLNLYSHNTALHNSRIEQEPERIAEVTFPSIPFVVSNPVFPGCRELSGKEKSDCSNQRMMDYIYRHTAYPAGKPIHKSAGIVMADFEITPKGTITNIRLLREPRRDKGKDVVRILKEMEGNGIRWEPATRNGQLISQRTAVTVRYNMVWVMGGRQ